MTTPDAEALGRMTDAFFAVDGDWRFTYLNERGRQVICWAAGREATVEELEGAHIWEEIPEAVETTFYEKYHEAMATQEPVAFEERYEPLDTWFEVRAYPDESGLSVYFRDVTDRKEREQQLRERERVLEEVHRVTADKDASLEEKVEALLAIGRDALGTQCGARSRIEGDEYVFEAVQDPTGATEPGDVVPLAATNCERAVATERTLVLEDVAADAPDLTDRAGFTEMGIECYLGTPVVVDGEVYGTFCFYDRAPREEPFTDWEVTLVELMGNWVSYEQERLRREAALRRERNRLEVFAGVVSHDLRNPLSVAAGRVDLAREERDDEHLAAAADALDRMDAIVEDVLALASAERSELDAEPLSLAEQATAAWNGLDGEARIGAAEDAPVDGEARLEVVDPGDGDRDAVVADEGLLRQLLSNVFANAMEHGGSTVHVGTTADGFYVADDGPGIPEDEREAVFDPGHTTSEDGTGFGLEVVRTVAEAHGWAVAVAESDAGGARFEFTGVERR